MSAGICGRSDCDEPASVTLILVSRSLRRWELTHCDEHREDGPAMAQALGFTVEHELDPMVRSTPLPV